MSRVSYGNRSTNNDRNYMRNLMTHISTDYERRRALDRALYPPGIEVKQTSVLQVEVTDFYPIDNAQEHKTDRFEIVRDSPASPVFRRGQLFYMAVRFDHPYDKNQDVIRLVFDFGPKPSVAKGTRQYLTMKQFREFNPDKNKWSLRLHNADSGTLTLQVFVPVTAQVGIWHCTVLTSRNDLNGHPPAEYKCPDDIYILFNPWCKDDLVYVDNDAWKEEYVLNDTGKVWMGSYRQPKGRRWIFGQHDDVVLPATMYLLELSDLPHSDRGNPILMVRAISAIINSLDEEGLMEGKWEGDFTDGINPHAWTGSVAIMEKYLQNGGTPVKYGQCWVFSGLVVTVCRALGIACRSVTNYVSAHDTNCSLTVDKFFDQRGEEIVGGPDGECYDSCWNFHVWNDVWMSRPDLPPGYGGWQVIDATPQEESGSMFRCGPASVEAVRNGKVGFSHDTPFVFAEVNADVCHFQENINSDWGFSRLQLNQYHVGRKIVTKVVGRNDDLADTDMEDVTLLYKNPEGSQEERLAVYNAVSGIETARKLYSLPKKEVEDVSFDLVEIDHIAFGEPFDVTVHIQNKSDKLRKVSAILSASSVYYTGATVHRLKRGQADFVLQPLQHETLKIKVKPEEYIEKMVNHSLIKIYAIATVHDSRQTWSEEDDFPLLKPKLSVEVQGNLKVGQECCVTLSFQNPLNVSLTDCTFSVEGFGLQRPKMMIKYRDIQPNELVTFKEYFHPKLAGERTIVGAFTSKQLSEVTGSATFSIQE